MSPINLILIVIGIIFVVALLLFPSFRGKLKVLCGGFLNVFVEDAAKTPDGARAVYQQAIEEAEDAYNRADNTLRSLSGKLESAKMAYEGQRKELSITERNCEQLVSKGDLTNAAIYAEKRESLLSDISASKTLIEQLNQATEEAKGIHNTCEKRLVALKKKSKEVVQQLQLNRQIQEAYNDLDELKRTSSIDKLLGSIDEGYKESREKAIGARIVHENRVSTKIEKAEQAAKNSCKNEYLESLAQKYNKK